MPHRAAQVTRWYGAAVPCYRYDLRVVQYSSGLVLAFEGDSGFVRSSELSDLQDGAFSVKAFHLPSQGLGGFQIGHCDDSVNHVVFALFYVPVQMEVCSFLDFYRKVPDQFVCRVDARRAHDDQVLVRGYCEVKVVRFGLPDSLS